MTVNDAKVFFGHYTRILQGIESLYHRAFRGSHDHLMSVYCVIPLIEGYLVDYHRTHESMYMSGIQEEAKTFRDGLVLLVDGPRSAFERSTLVRDQIRQLEFLELDFPEKSQNVIQQYTTMSWVRLKGFFTILKQARDILRAVDYHLSNLYTITKSIRTAEIDDIRRWKREMYKCFKKYNVVLFEVDKLTQELAEQINRAKILASGDREVIQKAVSAVQAPASEKSSFFSSLVAAAL